MKTMFVIAITLLFTISLISPSVAQEKPYSYNYSFTGRVTAVNFLGKNMTVRATGATPSLAVVPGDEFTFNLNEKTNITTCNEPKTLDSIKVGDEVTVNYHEENGKLYASNIALQIPLVACLTE
jgi:hypothetical protein